MFLKKISFSKILIFLLILNCTAIEIFTGYVTIEMLQEASIIGSFDFTPLVSLIGAVVTEAIGVCGYYLKSKVENSQGGITYDLAMRQFELDNSDNDEPVG